MDEVDSPEVAALSQSAETANEEPLMDDRPHGDAPGADTAEQLGLEPPSSQYAAEPLPDDSSALRQNPPSLDGAAQASRYDEKPTLPKERVALHTRPIMKRESSAPRPPAPIDDIPQEPQDSLTLADLKRIRSGFSTADVPPKPELQPFDKVYDFEYTDAQDFLTETEEWFAYNEQERAVLQGLQQSYAQAWAEHTGTSDGNAPAWIDSNDKAVTFVKGQVKRLQQQDTQARFSALQVICNLVLGNWHETAGGKEDDPFRNISSGDARLPSMTGHESSSLQIYWMIRNICLLTSSNIIPAVYEALRTACDRDLAASLQDPEDLNPDAPPRSFDERNTSTDIWCGLTILYFIIEVTRLADATEDAQKLRQYVEPWLPRILDLCTQITAQMRWDEVAPTPSSKLFLLFWKAMLLSFGGSEDLKRVKESFRKGEEEKDVRGAPVITASPLDYHLFRQEITSKYPSYQAPQPLYPFEPDNNTVLPPLEHRRARIDAMEAPSSVPSGNSLMHQPIHIATPAPSPPPSPAGPGGKGGKKQNYQTNQMFPFLYPPLDQSSNAIGGKGTTELQDALAGRDWQGSDIPASILEAAELFSRRMRATRGMQQLWEARVEFMKYDRGWREEDDLDLDKLKLEDSEKEESEGTKPTSQKESSNTYLTDTEKRLAAVEDFYRHSLPHIQSVVIVFLKAILKHVNELVYASGSRNRMQEANGAPHVVIGSSEYDDHFDKTRTDEIICKALSATLMLILKWSKVSHILQYEYITQLLLDANYIPLVLKLWQAQDIGRACHFKMDREDLAFFAYCRSQSQNKSSSTTDQRPRTASSAASSDDDAAPPPIKFRRPSSPGPNAQGGTPDRPSFSAITDTSGDGEVEAETDFTVTPPEVDELGYPTTSLPSSPLTTFSWRNTFTYTNLLRTMHKITHRKTHRALLLVSYKSSNHLRKSLRVPIAPLRHATLKLFKSQVPFCGRKWRQSNMKIITAVWLTISPSLRDDWLIGGGGGLGGAGPGDVDGTVEEALPLEHSLRALTYWWNVRNYATEMGVRETEERRGRSVRGDFFMRELEKMGIESDVLGRILREELGEDEAELEGEIVGMGEPGVEEGWVEAY